MKLKGQFILREIMGETVAIPTGQTALDFNGMICLNPVACEIWKGLQAGSKREDILNVLLEKFDVTPEDAAADLDDFLHRLKESNLVTDE